MKNKILGLLLGILVLISCDPDEFDDLANADLNYIGITTVSIPQSTLEGSAVPSEVTMRLLYDIGGERDDFDVTFTVDGSAQLGTDFTVPSATSTTDNTFTITVPGDTTVSSFTIATVPNIETATSELVMSANITSISDSDIVAAGSPVKTGFSIVIEDDDCPFVLADDYTGTGLSASNDGSFVSDAYTVDITLDSENTLFVTNFGDLGWDFFLDVDPLTNAVTIRPTGQYEGIGSCSGTAITDWDLSGGGALSPCAGEIVITEYEVVSEVICGGFSFTGSAVFSF